MNQKRISRVVLRARDRVGGYVGTSIARYRTITFSLSTNESFLACERIRVGQRVEHRVSTRLSRTHMKN
jgi:RNase P/RNase MRP subunit POP5